MRQVKLSLIVAVTSFYFTSSAQTNTFPANGSVGIGLLNPLQKFTIKSTGALTGISSTDYDFGITDGNASQVQLLGLVNTSGNYGLLQVIKGGIGPGNLIMQTQGGNVGIGTTSPISKLNVQSDDLQLQLTGASDVNKRLRLGYNTTGNYGSIQALRSGTTYDNFNINPDGGNVGIGTAAPSAKLHINASLTESAIKIGSPNVSGNINVPVGASTGGYNLDFYTWRDIQVDQIGARIRAERINSYQPNNALVQSMDLVFSTSTGGIQTELTEKLRINSAGNVSIGTSDAKGYKLAVNGNILATEIKVQAAPWPDYVFSKNYKLPALQSIEKHIKKEGYLPDMPSAKEVESNGINVGEMNAKLMKKIEELTLYIIDQNKELLNQKDQLNNLKKDNLELKKAVFGRKR